MTAEYLFDSYALLAFFQKERGAEIVAKILQESVEQRLNQLISVINLGEIIYMTKRRFGDEKKVEVLGRIHQLGLKILPAPEPLVYKAAEFKAVYPISYADCFALVCALENSAILVTGDPEFKRVAHLVDIQWIR
ncbi:MAG: type II toxin-antitoxin system VapC family toxin [Desulfatiglandaceae bacterium]